MLFALMLLAGGCVHYDAEVLADAQEHKLLNERLPGDPIPETPVRLVLIQF